MEDNLNIYCEFSFLQKFVSSCPKFELGKTNKEHKHWCGYYDLLCGNSNILFIDIEKEQFVEYCNEESVSGQMLTVLLSAHTDGIGCLKCLPKESENMNIQIEDEKGREYFSIHEHSIFLMDREKEDCEKMEEDYGLIFISPNNLFEYANLLFVPDIQEINQYSDQWSCIRKYEHPCNNIILVDSYIMNEKDDDIKSNLSSLFDSLLPTKLNKIEFSINIFTKETDDNQKNKKKIDLIVKHIPTLRAYPINVQVKLERNIDHDRYLLTNYCLINSGYGFILTEHKRRIGTSLSFFPICHYSIYSKKNNVYQIVQNIKRKRSMG